MSRGAAGSAGYAALVTGLTAQWQRIMQAVDRLDPAAWGQPTRIGWTVAELVAHLTRGTAAVGEAVASRVPGAKPEIVAEQYYDGVAQVAQLVTERARQQADAPPAELARRLRLASTAAVDAVTGEPAGAGGTVVRATGRLICLSDYLATRAVEAVVHGLDLPEPVAPDTGALRVTVRLLTRTLARRAPGRSIELRVPPHAAVQLDLPGVPGPRHTRGTPPNVVEAEPVAFVEVAAGRVDWAVAVAGGRVRASGERADLSGLLPLL